MPKLFFQGEEMKIQNEQLFARNFEQARQYAAQRMERELSPGLLYHGITHTRDEVTPTAELLAGIEGLWGESLYLLLTATWLHDIGFIQQSKNHELISAAIAAEALPAFGYSGEQIEIIRGAILATIVPQAPITILEKIMADADLNVLGRKNFLLRNRDLRSELAYFGQNFSDFEWVSGQLKFIEGHRFHTDAARALLNEQKAINIAEMKNVLVAITSF